MKAQSLEILEKANLPHAYARAILAAMDLEIAEHDTEPVRKGELRAVESELHGLSIRMQILEGRMERFDGRLLALEENMGELKAEIKAQGTKYVLWMFSMFVAFSGLILGVLGRGK